MSLRKPPEGWLLQKAFYVISFISSFFLDIDVLDYKEYWTTFSTGITANFKAVENDRQGLSFLILVQMKIVSLFST